MNVVSFPQRFENQQRGGKGSVYNLVNFSFTKECQAEDRTKEVCRLENARRDAEKNKKKVGSKTRNVNKGK